MSSKEIAVALIGRLPEGATLRDIAQEIELVAGAEVNHVRRDPQGRAWIDDSNVKVIEVALDHLATGSTPEELHAQYPHLSLAQIHAALAFYHDNRDEFDAEINNGLERADSAWAAPELPASATVARPGEAAMSVAIYMDVHVPRAITVALRARGVDVLTAQEDKAAQLPDSELLDRASALSRVLFRFDK